MQVIKLSESTAARRIVSFTMVTSANLQTRSTGLTSIAVRISKNGAATAAGGGTCTEVDSTNMPGVYYYTCATGDIDTLGQLILDVTHASQEPREIVVQIVAYDPFDSAALGLANIALPLAGTASAGGASTITLVGGVATDNYYKGQLVRITGGTGIGQARAIASYVGSTKVATVNRAWVTNPDSTSVFQVLSTDDFLQATDVSSISGAAITRTATAQGGSLTSITLDAGASSTDNTYDQLVCTITSGTGAGQSRRVLFYTGSTKVATMAAGWKTAPDSTSVFALLADARDQVTIHGGLAQGGGSTTITLDAGATATDGYYVGQLVHVVGGTGGGQAEIITSYVGSTRVATVARAWATAPDSTSVFVTTAAHGQLESTALTAVAAAVMSFTLRTGRTVKGHLRRMDALFFGKITGFLSSLATAYQPDGTTTEFTATQDTVAGTRATVDCTVSEGP